MAQKPWWLPEGVEPQQVIDLYKKENSAVRVKKILNLEVSAPTIREFLRKSGVQTNGNTLNCVHCGDVLNEKTINQRYCRKCAPDESWAWRLKNRGISKFEFDTMWENQSGLCDMCELPLGDNLRHVHIDHCHKQGHVRALLHQRCNAALGYIEDDKMLANAIRYIERHKR